MIFARHQQYAVYIAPAEFARNRDGFCNGGSGVVSKDLKQASRVALCNQEVNGEFAFRLPRPVGRAADQSERSVALHGQIGALDYPGAIEITADYEDQVRFLGSFGTNQETAGVGQDEGKEQPAEDAKNRPQHPAALGFTGAQPTYSP